MNADDRRLPGDGLPQDLFALTYQIECRIRRHFRGTRLHWGLRRILQRLWLEDGLSQKELSDRVGSSEASVSNMLKHLVAGEWVDRRQDAYDYRISRVFLSEQGKALKSAITEELQALDASMRKVLGETNTLKMESTIEKLQESLAATGWDEAERDKLQKDHPSPPGEL